MENNNQNNAPLTDEEIVLFEQLKKSTQTPGYLEQKVISALEDKHLINKNSNIMTQSTFIGIAATITALLCGFFIGKNFTSTSTTSNAMNKYILLLYENEDFNGREEAQMVSEYTQWATKLGESGHLESAEKLSDQSEWLGNASVRNNESHMVGYFVLLAKDYDEALSLAKTHPHMGYGGGVELRPIENLN